ncbi:MAG: glycosyltransferase family 9 protein [Betaproteobacteria bacterium]
MALAAVHGMKIAVFRPGGLGELLWTVPALRALDAAYPLQGSGEIANPLMVLMGAARTAGYYRFGRFCPDPRRYLLWRDGESEPARSLRLLEHLGVPPKGAHLELPLHDGDFRDAARFGAEGYALLHPAPVNGAAPDPVGGAAWTAERFAELGDALAAEGLPIALTGTVRGRGFTAAVKRAMRAPALDLAGAAPPAGDDVGQRRGADADDRARAARPRRALQRRAGPRGGGARRRGARRTAARGRRARGSRPQRRARAPPRAPTPTRRGWQRKCASSWRTGALRARSAMRRGGGTTIR